ncbi:MAG: aldo/keto reductase [SAR324 cluster bacterium]|nr:aldo/keto reductase [SAR324 cluster bacterium]
MRYQTLGTTSIEISRVIMGTWQAGKTMWAGIDDNQIQKALKSALDSGITTFDTAPIYGDGYSERTLAKAFRKCRSQVIYFSKVFPNKLGYEQVIQSCEQSLKNLETDVIDLLQIHWPAGTFGSKKVPIEETMRALVQLKNDGKIRAIGVSNFSAQQMEEARQFGPIESVQPPFSLFWRHAEQEILPYCQQHQMTLLAYSPLAQGILAGKFGEAPQFAKGDHRKSHRLFQPDVYPVVQQALLQLKDIADSRSVSLSELSLAWILHHEASCVIAGARNPEQVTSNARSADLVLKEDDFEKMNQLGSNVTDLLDDNPLQWR